MLNIIARHSWAVVALIISFCFGYYLMSGNSQLAIFILTCISVATGIFFFGFKKNLLFYLICFFVPLSIGLEIPGTGAIISAPSEILQLLLFGISLIYLIVKPIRKEILLHPITLLLVLDLFWLLITSIIGTMPEVSLKRLLMKSNYFMVFYVILTHFDSNKNVLSVKPFFYYAMGLIPVTLYILFKHYQTGFDPNYVFDISTPFYAEHTVYAASLAFMIPIVTMLITQSKNLNFSTLTIILVTTSFILILISQFLALSRAALLSLAFVTIVFLLIKLRASFTLLFSMLFLTIGSIYFFQDEIAEYMVRTEAVSNDGDLANHVQSVSNVTTDASNLERINRWICAIEMFKHKPITGYGLGTYQFEYAQFQSPENMTYISTRHGDKGNAHSEYLMYLSEAGIVGLLIFLIIVFYSVYLGIKIWQSNLAFIKRSIALSALLGLLTFYFHGLFNSFIDQDEMAFLYFSALGVLTLFDLERKQLLETS